MAIKTNDNKKESDKVMKIVQVKKLEVSTLNMKKTGLEAGMKKNSKLFANSVGKSLCHHPLLMLQDPQYGKFYKFPHTN